MAPRLLVLALLGWAAALIGPTAAQAAVDASGRTGQVRFVKRMTPDFDRHVTNPTVDGQAWLNGHLWRTEVFTPFFDSRTSWYKNGWVYKDLYAIGNGSRTAAEHPEWILKGASGEPLYIPWGCGNNWCPQYAADITNAGFRAAWIADLRATLARGYRGAWIDDVNLERRVSRASGADVAPVSPALGRAMSADDWRRAMADFTEQIRRELPNAELLHNSIWYAGQGAGRDQNADVRRQIASADYINVERGVNDAGLTGGTGDWGLRTLHGYVDRVHAMGKGVILDAFDNTPAGMEYSLANYLLLSTGADGVGEISQAPGAWWKGWDTDLGTALAGRYDWQGLVRRDFTGGLVLVNEPGAPTRTVTLPSPMTTLDGRTVTSVSVAAGRGVVLLGAGAGPGSGPTPSTPSSGSKSSTDGKVPASGTPSCRKVRVTYRTLRFTPRPFGLRRARGSARVCIDASLKAGTKAHRAAVRRATREARAASLRKARTQQVAARA